MGIAGSYPIHSPRAAYTRLTSRILSADIGDANTTLIYTGRPLRVRQTDYVKEWNNRQDEIKSLTSQGKIPHDVELQKHPEKSMPGKSWLMGDVSALIKVSCHLLPCRAGIRDEAVV